MADFQMAAGRQIRVGTSGFAYKHWTGLFYPADVPPSRWLEYYAGHFDCVEINSSFYRTPSKATLMSWRKRVPPDFVYVLKGPRFVTHVKCLKDCTEPVRLFFERARLLGAHLSAVLWQLPPRLEAAPELLADFLAALPPRPLAVVEFRHPSWFSPDTYAVVERAGASMCVHDMPESGCPAVLVGPALYMRFHGPDGSYGGSYSDDELCRRAEWAKSTGAETIFAFFNNDRDGHAVANAQTFYDCLC